MLFNIIKKEKEALQSISSSPSQDGGIVNSSYLNSLTTTEKTENGQVHYDTNPNNTEGWDSNTKSTDGKGDEIIEDPASIAMGATNDINTVANVDLVVNNAVPAVEDVVDYVKNLNSESEKTSGGNDTVSKNGVKYIVDKKSGKTKQVQYYPKGVFYELIEQ